MVTTPLHCACKEGSIDIVKFLIVDHHCNPACRGLCRVELHCTVLVRVGNWTLSSFLWRSATVIHSEEKDELWGHSITSSSTERS